MRMIIALAASLSVLPSANSAGAQTSRPSLDYASAAKIREGCLAWAAKTDKRVVITILDDRAMLVAFAHLDGASMSAGDISRWKANAAARFGRASADIAKLNPADSVPNVATIPGGVPIFTADDILLGGVGVSGGRPEDDVACAKAGIEAAGLRAEKRPAPPAQ